MITASKSLGTLNYLQAKKWQFYWLCALIASFSYERSLIYLTPYDRTNPRLFDLVVIIGVVTILPHLGRQPAFPRPFRIWVALVLWFCVCAILWAIMLPWEYGVFSLWKAARYLEGLIAIYIALAIATKINSQQKNFLLLLMVYSGIFIATYCIYEYYFEGSMVTINEGLEINKAGLVVGPFSGSYFQLAQTSSLLFLVSLGYFSSKKDGIYRAGGLIVSLFIAWPLFATGSRTGLGLLIISTVIFYFINKTSFKKNIIFIVFLVVVSMILASWILEIIQSSYTITRLISLEDDNLFSIENRTNILAIFSFESYVAGGLLPLIGGGFNVAPVLDGGIITYRIDFGVHNIYLFAFEQAGLIGIVIFLWFIVQMIKSLWIRRFQGSDLDRQLVNAGLAYFLAVLVVGTGAHNFWQGFDSGNANSFILIVLLIACVPSVNCRLMVPSAGATI